LDQWRKHQFIAPAGKLVKQATTQGFDTGRLGGEDFLDAIRQQALCFATHGYAFLKQKAVITPLRAAYWPGRYRAGRGCRAAAPGPRRPAVAAAPGPAPDPRSPAPGTVPYPAKSSRSACTELTKKPGMPPAGAF